MVQNTEINIVILQKKTGILDRHLVSMKGCKSDKERVPSGIPFLSHVIVGGGIPAASQVKTTGLLIVSLIRCSSGPPMLGGTAKKENKQQKAMDAERGAQF